jgi:hypothetical protein
VRAARVESPLQDVPFDDQGAGQVTVTPALPLRPDVDYQTPLLRHPHQRFWADPLKAVPGPLQDIVDGGLLIWRRARSR